MHIPSLPRARAHTCGATHPVRQPAAITHPSSMSAALGRVASAALPRRSAVALGGNVTKRYMAGAEYAHMKVKKQNWVEVRLRRGLGAGGRLAARG